MTPVLRAWVDAAPAFGRRSADVIETEKGFRVDLSADASPPLLRLTLTGQTQRRATRARVRG